MEWLKGKVGAAKADGAAAAGAAAAGAAAAGRTLPAQKHTTLERYFDEFKYLPYIAVIQELYKTGVWEPYFQPPRKDGQNWHIYVTYIPIFDKVNNTENHYHFFMDERGPGFSLKVNNKHTYPGYNGIPFEHETHNLKFFEEEATVKQVWGVPGGGAASPGIEATAGGPQTPSPKAAKKQDPKYSNRDMFAFSPEGTQDSSPQDSSTSSPARKKTKPEGAGGGYAITKKKMPRKKKSRKLRSKKKKTRKKARKKSRRKKYTNK